MTAPTSGAGGGVAQQAGPTFHFAANAISITGSSAATQEGVRQTVREAIEEVFEQTAHMMAA
jgi:hypothetical protein